MTVTALLVCHDGARWLPAVLEGLEGQTRRPDRVLAVDTGGKDTSVDLVRTHLGLDSVISARSARSFGAAVTAGLDAAAPSGSAEAEWVWLLHDDSSPDPRALELLLQASRENPSAAVLGPKLREWPSLRRLLEVGVTISGTGRRETGLERGEYDQGQHDRQRDVLAVNTAGMLVRREVLEQLGFDRRLPLFGNDIDFGWRAARAGHRTLVVPDAVVFHAEAAHRGLRRTPVTTSRFRRAERRAALYTILVNCSPAVLPVQLVRLFFGSLLRMLGLLLVRAPGEAGDELLALLATYARPDLVIRGRIVRRRTAKLPAKEVRHLLAPTWLPYRHGLDFIGDIAAAVVHQAEDMSTARRARRAEEIETGPVPVEAESLPPDTGVLARLLTSPVAAVFAVLTVLSVVSARGLLGSGTLSGGALLPAPGGAGDWWSLYLESWHHLETGSSAPSAPYLLPLAVVGTLLLGKAWLVVDLLFFFAVPLAAFGAYRFLRRVTESVPPALWGGAAYGLLSVLAGSVHQGRLGTVAASVVLPWLAQAALFLSPDATDDRRWRAAWRTTLLLALVSAFAPVAWLLAVLVGGLVLVAGLARDSRRWGRRPVWGALVLPLVLTPVLLLPWSVFTVGHQGPASWLFEAGLPAPDLAGSLDPWSMVAGHPDGAGAAPIWLSLGVAVAALAALLRSDTRARVLRAWVVLVLALVATSLLALPSFTLATMPGSQHLWLGVPLLVVQGAGITAAAIAGTGIWAQVSRSSFGWRQPVGLLLVGLAVLAPVAGLVWWAAQGSGDPVDRRAATTVPTYMTEAAVADPDHGVLVVRGATGSGFEYVVLRGDGRRLGEDSALPTVDERQAITDVVSNLATAADPTDIAGLADRGVQFIYAEAPADRRLAGNLDSVSGLSPASALHPGSRAWQVEADATTQALPQPEASLRPWLLALQGLAIVVAAVLAAPPTRRVRR